MADPRPAALTALSFEVVRTELISRVNALRAAAGKPPLNLDHASNPHLIILEALSLMAELDGKTIDNRSLAFTLVSSRNLEDATINADNLGYDWRGVTPAVATVELDLGVGGWAQDIILADGRTWLASPSYIQAGAVTIPAGQRYASIPVRQATRFTYSAVSNGTAGQQFTLPDTPIVKKLADGSIPVTVLVDSVDVGVVESLFLLDPTDTALEMRVDYLERGIFTTGDGTNGVVIAIGLAIDITYETSLGSTGGIGAATITAPVGTILDVLSNPVTVTVTQPAEATGGLDRESLDSMQYNGPRALTTLDASLNSNDFEANAEAVGALRALALTRKDDGSIAPNVTLVLIAGTPAITGETILFSDDHEDGVVLPAEWTILAGTWAEVAGVLTGGSPTSEVKVAGLTVQLPIEVRATAYVAAGQTVELRLRTTTDTTDYLYCRIADAGGGNADVAAGQYLDGVATETTATIAKDVTTPLAWVMRFTLADGLELEIDGLAAVSHTPVAAMRKDFDVVLRGQIRSQNTAVAVLLDYPTPNQTLIDDVAAVYGDGTGQTPTLVSHNVQVGELSFRPLNLILETQALPGYTSAQAQTNIRAAIATLLEITRRDEDGEFVNQPGESFFAADINEHGGAAEGVRWVRVIWPTDFEFTLGDREFFVPGEIVFQ